MTKGCFKLHNVDEEVVLKQLKGLNPSKAVGLDGISARFLRDGASCICKYVTHLVNLSIKTSTVPSEFKCAKVVPI